jgi:pyridoxal phosphate enzyme (YggS family)
MTTEIQHRLDQVRRRIAAAERNAGRAPGSVQLVAVSKTRPSEAIRQALACGQTRFGENYVQEAVEKIRQLGGLGLEWHFIGRIQSNKTAQIAQHFDWVHCLADSRHARRLNDQRPPERPRLKVCVQVNVSGEPNKAGLDPEVTAELLARVRELPRLDVCGLMAIPAPALDFNAQRRPFAELRTLRDRLAKPGQPLATLSMGMSADLEAAIAEGATLVRVGTAIFGPRLKGQDQQQQP